VCQERRTSRNLGVQLSLCSKRGATAGCIAYRKLSNASLTLIGRCYSSKGGLVYAIDHRLPEGTRQGMDAMSIRDTILSVFRTVAADQGRTLAPLSDELPLVKCGLDSLCFAIVVASLEDSLHVDPFNAPEWVDFPVTLGDFVKLYDRSTA
jgi:hypothetical protein